ncbi:MAG: hypothetical protein Q8P81_01515 [Nanoarchaeota archaeon]|nr:hypothetical protein [Nanoarchaeota archaeon]
MEVKKMSVQMMKAIMISLQKCIAEEVDIMKIFEDFDITDSDDGLVVLNPPTFKVDFGEQEEETKE